MGFSHLALAWLRDLWNSAAVAGRARQEALEKELRALEGKIDQLLDRLVDATGDTVIAAYEKRLRALETQKALLKDRIATSGKPRASFDETYRTACDFLANPWKLWGSDRLEDRRAVLRLVFAEKLPYARNEGYRTAKMSIPFKMLGGIKMPNVGMVAEPVWREPVWPRFP
jgi:hypothetical protein